MTQTIEPIDPGGQAGWDYSPSSELLDLVAGDAAGDDMGDWSGAEQEDVQGEGPKGVVAGGGPGPLGAGGIWMTDLANIARTTGRRVVEVPGWRTRGRSAMTAVEGIMWHHTATSSRASGDYPTLRVVRDGHGALPGPLCHYGIGRSGTIYVVAAGRANHAGSVYETWQQNSRCIGVEVEGDGKSPFNRDQLDTISALGAALHKSRYGIPVERNTTHKEAGYRHYRKTDPLGVTSGSVQAAVRGVLAAPTRLDPGKVIHPDQVPAPLAVDGLYGPGTHRAFMWWIDGDQLVGMTRDNVRDIQTWAGRDRTGVFTADDYRAIQTKVGAPVDGDWPWRWGTTRASNTTTAIQNFLNRRINEQE